MDVIGGGITAPRGFTAAGIACGIKKNGRRDLALVVSDRPAAAAGIFTVSLAPAAPVVVSRAHLDATAGVGRAVVINSGCANACTGAEGLETARLMTIEAARALGCDAEEVLVASTGVIGVALDRLVAGRGIIAAAAALDRRHHAEAAEAIMTTDPFPKSDAVRVTLPGGTFTVGGMAKGSGMIEPMMATMLAVLTTDAAVPPALLRRALVEACDTTFNAITVDGECSTNDSVFALANGASGVEIDERSYSVLVEALASVARTLALDIVRGGEGATKLIEVRVTGAASGEDARRAAKAIANSLLVKTAVHGGDPNWGRLVAVAGRCGSAFDLARARVTIGEVELFVDGRPFDERADDAGRHLAGREVVLQVDLGTGGSSEATVWTCDLSAEYVKINAEYRT
ncbi:MAG: bifunctional glutamate N-acetyltransferase/amino-acid acetyltransferase ArgJ [Vicinamibacteraceae bacterium]|nr:bifunctional glutamate N-acetyltransferase/amino-acid acetyltransferase ArgJ [Vicinamibacteraceae bacterium]